MFTPPYTSKGAFPLFFDPFFALNFSLFGGTESDLFALLLAMNPLIATDPSLISSSNDGRPQPQRTVREFDGTHRVDTDIEIDFTQPWEITAWLKIPSLPVGSFFIAGTSNTNNSILIDAGGRIDVRTGGGTNGVNALIDHLPPSQSLGSWQLYKFGYDGVNLFVEVDGDRFNQPITTPVTLVAEPKIGLGARYGNSTGALEGSIGFMTVDANQFDFAENGGTTALNSADSTKHGTYVNAPAVVVDNTCPHDPLNESGLTLNHSKGLDLDFDFYVDGDNGSDSNDGLSIESPKKTLSTVVSLLDSKGVGTITNVFIAKSDYIDQSLSLGFFAGTATIVFEKGSSMEWTLGVDQSGIQQGNIATAILEVFANGLLVKGFNSGTGNGLGCNNGLLKVHDCVVRDCLDGASSHGTGRLELYGCDIRDCIKGQITHTGSGGSVTEDCTLVGMSGSFIVFTTGSDNVVRRSTMIGEVDDLLVGLNSATSTTTLSLEDCQIGDEDHYIKLQGVTCSKCYVNAYSQGDRFVYLDKCFGKFTYRLRNGGGASITNCTFNGGSQSDAFIYTNFDSGSFSKLVVENCIVSGYGSSAVEFSTRSSYWVNSGSTIDNSAFFGNTSDFDAGATGELGSSITNTSYIDISTGSNILYEMAEYVSSDEAIAIQPGDVVDIGSRAIATYTGEYIPASTTQAGLDAIGNPLQWDGTVYPVEPEKKGSYGMSLDGTQAMETTSRVSDSGQRTDISVSFYIKAGSNPLGYIVGEIKDNRGWGVRLQSGKISWFSYPTSGPEFTKFETVDVVVDSSKFVFVEVSYLNGGVSIYVDGEMMTLNDTSSGSPAPYIRDHNNPVIIGGKTVGSVNLIGELAGVIVDGKPYYLAESNGTTAYDSSGNDNHGTYVNAPATITQDVVHTHIEDGFSFARECGVNDGVALGEQTVGANETWEGEAVIKVDTYTNTNIPIVVGNYSLGVGLRIYDTGLARVFSKLTTGSTPEGAIPLGGIVKVTYGFDGTNVYVDLDDVRSVTKVAGDQSTVLTDGLSLGMQDSGVGNPITIYSAKFSIGGLVVYDSHDFDAPNSMREIGNAYIPAINATTDAIGQPLTNPAIIGGHNGAETIYSTKTADDGEQLPAIKLAGLPETWATGDPETTRFQFATISGGNDRFLGLPEDPTPEEQSTIDEYHA